METGILELLQKLDICLEVSTKEEAGTIFMELLSNNAQFDVLSKALKYIDINGGFDEKTNPLFFACVNKNCELVKFLVENGADVNKTTTYGSNSIMFSYQKGDFSSFMYLYQRGAVLQNDKHSFGEFHPSGETLTKFIVSMLSVIKPVEESK